MSYYLLWEVRWLDKRSRPCLVRRCEAFWERALHWRDLRSCEPLLRSFVDGLCLWYMWYFYSSLRSMSRRHRFTKQQELSKSSIVILRLLMGSKRWYGRVESWSPSPFQLTDFLRTVELVPLSASRVVCLFGESVGGERAVRRSVKDILGCLVVWLLENTLVAWLYSTFACQQLQDFTQADHFSFFFAPSFAVVISVVICVFFSFRTSPSLSLTMARSKNATAKEQRFEERLLCIFYFLPFYRKK